MYLINVIKKNVRQAAMAKKPFGPAFDAQTASMASRMEVWGTSLNDAGADYCEFKLFDKFDRPIDTKQVGGY